MSNEKFNRIMGYLDIIEAELTKISLMCGGIIFEQFKSGEENGP